MRALPFLGVAILGVVVGVAPNARAAVVLDQQYLVPTITKISGFSNSSGFRRAETFTVGVAGTLSEIDIFLAATVTFSGFNILATSAGVPTTTVLTTGTLSSSSSTEAAFTVSLPVTVGEVLAIEPVQSGGPVSWLGAVSNTYAGGGDFFLNPSSGVNDFTPDGVDDFQTFVTTAAAAPEPASLLLLGPALVGMAALRRGRG
jgi:hypothetical protein